MSFTYDLPFTSDRDRIRFHLGDTDPNAPRFSDEEIAAVLSEYTDWRRAVVACIRSMIGRLTVPDFKADWLQVQPSKAREGYERLLKEKAREFGISGNIGSGITLTYRLDSDATAPPSYPPNSSGE